MISSHTKSHGSSRNSIEMQNRYIIFFVVAQSLNIWCLLLAQRNATKKIAMALPCNTHTHMRMVIKRVDWAFQKTKNNNPSSKCNRSLTQNSIKLLLYAIAFIIMNIIFATRNTILIFYFLFFSLNSLRENDWSL